MRVLIACEFSGVVRRAFRELGHDAWSCDLLPADDASLFHIQGDARRILGDGWNLLIAHPTCTRLCNSGVRWLHERNLWADLDEACDLFLAFLNAPISRIAVENPVMHKYARERIGRGHDFSVQPYEHGHGETKRTCFWTRNLPPLVPTDIVAGREARIHRMPPGPDRWKERSRTFPGIASAMASQWGSLPALAEAA